MSRLSDEDCRIRDFNPSDYEDLIRFWEITDLARPERRDDLDVINKTIRQGGALGLMLHKDGRIVGSVWITHDGRRTFIHHFAIHPDFRGKGLSHKLMDFTIEIIESLGLQVKLEVHRENHIAQNLYKKYHFKLLEGYQVLMKR